MKSSRARRLRFARLFSAGLLVSGAANAQARGASDPAASPDAPGTPALLELASDSSCPSSSAVADVLRQILGVRAGERVAETARLERRPTELVVTLRAPDARVLGERALPLEGNCDELARASAVVLATWLSDVHPEFVPKTPPAPNAPNPAAAATNGVTASGAAATNGVTSTGAVTPNDAAKPNGAVRSTGSVRPRGTFRLRIAASLGVAVLPTPPAVAGGAAVSLVPDAGGIGATLRLGAVATHAFDVQGGQARYFRWPFGAGAVVRFAGPALAAELDAGATLGWLHVEGRSFSPDRSADDVTFGPFAAARFGAAHGLVRPFFEVWSAFWIPSARVYTNAGTPSQRLPSLDLTLSLGATLVP